MNRKNKEQTTTKVQCVARVFVDAKYFLVVWTTVVATFWAVSPFREGELAGIRWGVGGKSAGGLTCSLWSGSQTTPSDSWEGKALSVLCTPVAYPRKALCFECWSQLSEWNGSSRACDFIFYCMQSNNWVSQRLVVVSPFKKVSKVPFRKGSGRHVFKASLDLLKVSMFTNNLLLPWIVRQAQITPDDVFQKALRRLQQISYHYIEPFTCSTKRVTMLDNTVLTA